MPYLNAVTSDYLGVVRTPITKGRDFRPSEELPVAIVNETLSNYLSSVGSPVGQCLELGDDPTCFRVIGVARDSRRFTLVPEAPTMQVFVPLSQNHFRYGPATVLVRARDRLGPLMEALRGMVQLTMPPSAGGFVRQLEDLTEPQIRPWRASTSLFIAFGSAGLIVTLIGIYAAAAYSARQRRRETAIRSALGEPRVRLLGRLAAGTTISATAGVLLGGVVAVLVASQFSDSLFGVRQDATALIERAGIGAMLVAALASWLGGWRSLPRSIHTALNGEG